MNKKFVEDWKELKDILQEEIIQGAQLKLSTLDRVKEFDIHEVEEIKNQVRTYEVACSLMDSLMQEYIEQGKTLCEILEVVKKLEK